MSIRPDGYPKRWPQPAASLTYFLNDEQVGRGNKLNIVGAGITTRPFTGDGITYDLSALSPGGGGNITIGVTSVIGGNPHEVLYIDPTGNLVESDSNFIRNQTTEGAALAAYTAYTEVTGLTLTNTQIIKITGEAAGVGAATDDIVAKLGTISWNPAA